MRRQRSLIAVADEKVPIIEVCRLLGVSAFGDVNEGSTRKVHCPFGAIYHSDGGVSMTMRIYADTNTAWCFNCTHGYTPTKMAARAWDMDRVTAAGRLLGHIGWFPPSLDEVWQELANYHPPVDIDQLAEALKTFCRRVTPDWAQRQFVPVVAERLSACLSLLALVSTDDDARAWLNGCKSAMLLVLQIPRTTP